MAPGRIDRLLRPRSIAVIGGRPAARVVRQCDRLGFAGPIWPIHPDRDEIEGRPCLRSIAELPAPPDAAFIGVNRLATVAVAAELAAAGAGGAVAYAAGFGEAGPEGAALQDRLVAAAGAMPVLGPNCYGLVNALDRVALWPDLHGAVPVERGVALVTQSSNIAINLSMSRRALPIAMVIALGNQAMVGPAEAVAALAEDPRITAIGLHLEAVGDVAALAAAAEAAFRRGVRIVAIKGGRSAAGAAVAASHTAALSGARAVTSALFRRLGIAEVGSLPALLETLKLLHAGGPLPGPRLVALQCSGGEAALIADAVEGRALALHPFDADATARIAATTHPLVTIANPFDYHTFDWGDRTRLAATFGAVLAAGQDATVLLLDWPRPEVGDAAEWDASALALADATGAAAGAPRTALIATVPETMPEAMAATLMARGVAPLLGIEDGLTALEAAAMLGETVPGMVAPPGRMPTGPRRVLAEAEAKPLLAAAGLAVPDGRLCRTAAEVAAAGAALGFPLAAKAAAGDLLHKTERGGVRLGLTDAAALDAAWRALSPLGGAVLVERMVEGAVAELILGVARDPVVGLHLVIGAGGVLAELLEDSQILLLPTGAGEIRAALARLRVAPLLAGFRGRPPGDVAAVVEAALALARFAAAHAETLVEIDVNPLMVLPEGRGAVAADALIVFAEESPP